MIRDIADELIESLIENSGVPREMIEHPDLTECAKIKNANNIAAEYYIKLRTILENRMIKNYETYMNEVLNQNIIERGDVK